MLFRSGTAGSWQVFSTGGSSSTLSMTYDAGGTVNVQFFTAASGSYDLAQGYWVASSEL